MSTFREVLIKFLDRLLGKKAETLASKQMRAILQEQERISDLCLSMTTTALRVGEFLKPHFTAPTKAEKNDQWFWAQVEVLHFLLHMTNRVALKKLGTERRRLLGDKVAPRVFHAFVGALCTNLSQEEQDKLRTYLLEETQEREVRYAKCSSMIGDVEKDLFDMRNLFSLATELVLEATGREADPQFIVCDPPLFIDLHLRIVELYGDAKIGDKVLIAGEAMSTPA